MHLLLIFFILQFINILINSIEIIEVDNDIDSYGNYSNCYSNSGLCNLRSAWNRCNLLNTNLCEIILPIKQIIYFNCSIGTLYLNENINIDINGQGSRILPTGKSSTSFISTLSNSSINLYNVTVSNFGSIIYQDNDNNDDKDNIHQSMLLSYVYNNDYVYNDDYSYIDDNNDHDNFIFSITSTIIINKSRFSFSDLIFESNNGASGGVLSIIESIGNISNCIFLNNSASNGGSLWLESSNITMYDNKWSDNSANNGGVIFCNLSSLLIINNEFYNNNVTNNGGVVYQSASSVIIKNSTFMYNKAYYNSEIEQQETYLGMGGVLYSNQTSNGLIDNTLNSIIIYNSLISNNIAGISGSAVYYSGTSYSLFDNTVFDNNEVVFGSSGGCLCIFNSDYFRIFNSNFTNNTSNNVGSMKIESSSNIYIFNSNFIGNTAKFKQDASRYYYGYYDAYYGYGDVSDEKDFGEYSNIYFSNSDNITISSCIIKQNIAASYGSISFDVNNSNINIDSSIFEENIANQGISAGLYFGYKNINVTIDNCIFNKNSAQQDGTAIYINNYNQNIIVMNTIISNNIAICGNGGGIYMNKNNINITLYKSIVTKNLANSTNCQIESEFDAGRGGGVYYNANNNYLYIIGSEINNNIAINGGGLYLSNYNTNFVIMDELTYTNMRCFETSHPYTTADYGYFDANFPGASSIMFIFDSQTDISQGDSIDIHVSNKLNFKMVDIIFTGSRYYPGIDEEALIVEGDSFYMQLKQIDPPVPPSPDSYGYKFCAFPLYINPYLNSIVNTTKHPTKPPSFTRTPSMDPSSLSDVELHYYDFGSRITNNSDVDDDEKNFNVVPYGLSKINYNFASEDGGSIYFNLETPFPIMLNVEISNGIAVNFGAGLFAGNGNYGLTLYNCFFKKNQALNSGGAIYLSTANYASIFISNIFYNNTATIYGAAIFLAARNGYGFGLISSNNQIVFQRCHFNNNYAQYGGAISMFYENSVNLNVVLLSSNHAIDSGGGIYIDTSNVLNISASIIKLNRANSGGGVYSKTKNKVYINISRINLNYAELSGGGVYFSNNTNIIFTGVNYFESNYAATGGAIYARSIDIWNIGGIANYSLTKNDTNKTIGIAAESKVIFQGNKANRGSAIALSDINFPGNSQLNNLTFQNNTAYIAATVYWLYDNCEKKCSSNVMNKEPPGSFSETMDWKDSNIAPYGKTLGTQPIFINVDTSERLITSYGKVMDPPLSVTLYDYYNQEVVSDNTTTITLSLSSIHCHDEIGTLVGQKEEFSSNGIVSFENIDLSCYPEGNMTIQYSAEVSEVLLFNVYSIDSYTIANSSLIKFRECKNGEKLVGGNCVQCGNGTYSLIYEANTIVCNTCPSIAKDCYSNTIDLTKGYWRRQPLNNYILECPRKHQCIGGDGTGDELCLKGSEGPMCAVCSNNYYFESTSDTCVPCNNGGILLGLNVLVPVGILLLIGCIYAAYVYNHLTKFFNEEEEEEEKKKKSFIKSRIKYVKSRIDQLMAKSKIAVSTYQILEACPSNFQITYPAAFNNFLNSLNFVNFNFIQFVPLSCSYKFDHVDSLLVTTISPFLFTMVIFIAGIAEYMYKSKDFIDPEKNPHDSESNNITTEIIEYIKMKKELWMKIQYRYFSIFLFMTYLILPSTTSTIFTMFICQDIDPNKDDPASYGTDNFLVADFSISCNSERYYFGFFWAVAMCIVYPIGLPFLYYVLLYKCRDDIVNRKEMIEKGIEPSNLSSVVQFLYKSYKPEFWYFEIVETTRRLMLTAVLSTIASGSSQQVVAALFLSLIYINVYKNTNPYVEDEVVIMAEIGQWQIFGSFFFTLIIKKDLLGVKMNTTVAICMILMNISIAFAAAGFEYFSYRKEMIEEGKGYENSDKVLRSFFDAIEGSEDDKGYVLDDIIQKCKLGEFHKGLTEYEINILSSLKIDKDENIKLKEAYQDMKNQRDDLIIMNKKNNSNTSTINNNVNNNIIFTNNDRGDSFDIELVSYFNPMASSNNNVSNLTNNNNNNNNNNKTIIKNNNIIQSNNGKYDSDDEF